MTNPDPHIEGVAKTVPDIIAAQVEKLKTLFPECVTEGKVDKARLLATLGDLDALAGDDAYTFTWAGKQEAFRAIQTPSAASLQPVPEESVNWDTTKHIFIEGENLEVLKLLYKSYVGKIKVICIDPPYNTGNDFIYRDDYREPLRAYLEKTGQVDAEGNVLTSNPETRGRFHSDWLTMMYPRLFLARQLLREDGVIFVSIDDNEVYHLRLLMNEIFGEENFIAQIIWKSRQFPDTRAVTNVSTDHEYVLAYSRTSGTGLRGVERDLTKFANPDHDPRGPWMSRSILGLATFEQRPNLHYEIADPSTGNRFRPPENTGWRYSKERMQTLIDQGAILFPSTSNGRPREKKFQADLASELIAFPSIIDDVFTAHGTAEIRDLFGFQVFDFPKPTELLRRLIEQASSNQDIVMDFFGGAASTVSAILQQNRADGACRKAICVQLTEPVDPRSEVARQGYTSVAEIAKERIRREIRRLRAMVDEESLSATESEIPQLSFELVEMDSRSVSPGAAGDASGAEDFGFKSFKLAPSTFRRWASPNQASAETLEQQLSLFDAGLKDSADPQHVLYEVLLKEGYSLNSTIAALTVGTNTIYRVTDEPAQVADVPEEAAVSEPPSFYLCIDDAIAPDVLDALSLDEETVFICQDASLDDSQKVNLALQCVLKTM